MFYAAFCFFAMFRILFCTSPGARARIEMPLFISGRHSGVFCFYFSSTRACTDLGQARSLNKLFDSRLGATYSSLSHHKIINSRRQRTHFFLFKWKFYFAQTFLTDQLKIIVLFILFLKIRQAFAIYFIKFNKFCYCQFISESTQTIMKLIKKCLFC